MKKKKEKEKPHKSYEPERKTVHNSEVCQRVTFHTLGLQASLLLCFEEIKYFNSAPKQGNYVEKGKIFNGLKIKWAMIIPLISPRRKGKTVND